jgi:hypothetical protein
MTIFLRTQLQHRKKITGVRAILKDNQLLRRKRAQLVAIKKRKSAFKFINLVRKDVVYKRHNIGVISFTNRIICHNFLTKLRSSLIHSFILPNLLKRYIKQ